MSRAAEPVERDDTALARFDLFLVVAVGTVLVTRAYLAVTGYPQVGGSGNLHVAHVLWGGLLMAMAIVLIVLLPGSRIKVWAALLGGVGFGLFIDEVGKFVTKDVDYFFKPAIAIMYATFVALYLWARWLVRRRPFTPERRLAFGAQAIGDLALGQLDARGQQRALSALAGVPDDGPHGEAARVMTAALHLVPPAHGGWDSWLTHVVDVVRGYAVRVLSTTGARRTVLAVCAVQAVSTLVDFGASLSGVGPGSVARGVLDTGLPSLVSAVLLLTGVFLVLRRYIARGLELLEWSIVVDLLFVQLAVFNREQWLGLVGFGVSAVMLTTLRLARSTSVAPA